MNKIFIFLLIICSISCNRENQKKKTLRGNWYSYENQTYSEHYFDSTKIYSFYEDFPFPPPVYYKYVNDNIYKFIDKGLTEPHGYNAFVKFASPDEVLLTYPQPENTIKLIRIHDSNMKLGDIKTSEEENEYSVNFWKRRDRIKN